MRKFGLIGYPLGHSFSKKYFAEKFINEHIKDCHYDNYSLTDLGQLNKLIHDDSELEGLNITIPYKSQIISFLDEVDTEAVEIGAVNVLKIKRINGKIKLFGFNSDVTGIRESLAPYINKKIKNAIVLGTGGSSKAVCYVLKKFGSDVVQISRNKKPGILTYSDIDFNLIGKTGIIVNTTPLGMFPNIETKPDIDYSLINKNHILFDLVYNPEKTSFLKCGEERGCTIISGIKMLHSQAERSWQIWNDENM
jgi:shikimate dehydrogenase